MTGAIPPGHAMVAGHVITAEPPLVMVNMTTDIPPDGAPVNVRVVGPDMVRETAKPEARLIVVGPDTEPRA